MNDIDLNCLALHPHAEAINVAAAENQQAAQQDRLMVAHFDANINEELPLVQGNGVPIAHPPLAAGQSFCSQCILVSQFKTVNPRISDCPCA